MASRRKVCRIAVVETIAAIFVGEMASTLGAEENVSITSISV